MRLIRSELRKFFSTRTWLWLLIGCVVLALVQTIIFLAFAGTTDSRTGIQVFPEITDPEMQRMVLSAPANATIFIVILGILGVTAEYRHKTMAPTFLATPHRWQVLAAKLVTYLLLGIVYAAVAALFVVLVSWIWINSADGSFTLAGDNGQTLIGAAAASALYGIIGVGVGALVRNQIGALAGMLAFMFVIEPILSAIPATSDVYKFLPGGAGAAMYTTFSGGGFAGEAVSNLLSPLQGGLVLTGYALVLSALAYAVSTRREVA